MYGACFVKDLLHVMFVIAYKNNNKTFNVSCQQLFNAKPSCYCIKKNILIAFTANTQQTGVPTMRTDTKTLIYCDCFVKDSLYVVFIATYRTGCGRSVRTV